MNDTTGYGTAGWPVDDPDPTGPAGTVEPIAIIGLACRLPGAGTVDQFWQNLVNGVESVRFYSREEQVALGVSATDLDDPNFVPAHPALDDLAGFDAALFGMSRREAELRDPQQRLFLELAHAALEDSGYDPAQFDGEIGVYGGIGGDEYQWHYIRRNPAVLASAGTLAVAVGNHPDYLATITAYKLNLRGPALTVHSACSTTLVAFHLACEALRNGECDLALTGGASIELPPGRGYVYADGGILTRDGHTRTFDVAASGTLWGSGGGAVVLKRLSDAIRDGDHIRAVARGSAVNNDGSDKVGFSAPSMQGQAAVIAQALGIAAVDPRTVSYVEAHGTATGLGDPIEVAALTTAFAQNTDEIGWCGLGSVKTNIGHLGAAAGVAGLIKTVLVMEHGLIPASLNFEQPNPKLALATSPFYVNATLSRWPEGPGPRRAGVSSFGVGGTNAHAVLEQAPPVARPRGEARPAHLLQVSARTETALGTLLDRLATRLREHPDLELADVAYTLRHGRRELGHRAAVVAADTADAAAALGDAKRRVTAAVPARPPRVAFLFSGQGSQYAGMGGQLYRTEPVYRAAVDECLRILAAVLSEDPGDKGPDGLDTNLRALLLDPPDSPVQRARADATLGQTALTQPALFTVEYALARLWMSWGVRPEAMIGHSIGEYVAATLAGVFTLPEALGLVAARGRLMQSMPAGAMLAVQLDEAEASRRLPDGLALATINGPGACVVAGPGPLIEQFAVALDADGIGSKVLRTAHAFHSPMMEPILADFRALVAAVGPRAPQSAFLSNVTGDWIGTAEATDPSYWARHLREPVRFGDCLGRLLAEGEVLLLECGPGKQLAGLARMHLPRSAPAPLTSLPGPGEKRTDVEVLYASAGRLWVSGTALDSQTFGAPGYRVPLVPYPYERKRYWVEATLGVPGTAGYQEASGPRPVDDWFTVPVWREEPHTSAGPVPSRCLVFVAGVAGQEVRDRLCAAGVEVIEVRPGTGFARLAPRCYQLSPGQREDYDALLTDLVADGGAPDRVVHTWALDSPAAGADPDAAWAAQDRGFFSLPGLVQASAAAQLTVHLDVLTAGTQDVLGGDANRPEHATVAGIAKVVPQEYPAISVRHIDVADGTPAGLDAALTELRREPEGGAVALRGGRRWVQDYRPVRVPAGAGSGGLRDGGVYLITGGLGGLGITLAEDLAHRVQAGLVLLARSPLPPRDQWQTYLHVHGATERTGRAIAAIRRMEAAGARVLTLVADVTSVADLRAVRERVLAEFGRLDGIVHSAGVAGGGMAEVKQRPVAEAVLAPKLRGTLALRVAFGDLPVDFVALFSSVTSVAGGFGQVDYCAANNFLDAYARGQHGWAGQVTALNWGGWLEVGMAAEVAAPAAFRALQHGDRITVVDHPVISALHPAVDEMLPWASGVVAPDIHWVLDEHRIAGVPVMPGTGHLENVRCAFEAVAPATGQSAESTVELRDVVFVAPMAVADGSAAELRVIFADGTDGLDFQVASISAGAATVHVRGSAGRVEAGPAATVDLAAIRARCSLLTHEVDPADAGSNSGLLTFGPRFASLRRVFVGQDEELAVLEAPELVAAELHRWVLHPALLDEATSFGRGTPGGRYLPLGYGRVLVRDALPAHLYSHLRYRGGASAEVITMDLSLYDEHGRELVAITDFVLRRIDADAIGHSVASTAHTSTARPQAAASTETGISPADGAEAFHRVLAAGLGAQVIITAQPLARVLAGVASVTQESVSAELDPQAATEMRAESNREGYVAPQTELEITLANLWGAVLGVDAIGVQDDFFDLGGNSLIAVQLISQVRKQIGVKLPMRSLFETPTVAGMVVLAEGLRAAASAEAPGDDAIPRLPRRAQ